MFLTNLDAKNPSYDAQLPIWQECNALYHGGAAFDNLIGRFLPPNPSEPAEIYHRRCHESSYLSYVTPIIQFFVSWLYSSSFTVRAKDADTGEALPVDQAYSDFQADIGGDQNITEFVKDRTTDALIFGASHWLLEFPDLEDNDVLESMSKADYQERGLDTATLCCIPRDSLYDWECDEYGKLVWAIIHDISEVRPDPRTGLRDMIKETWHVYDRENVEAFGFTYEKGKRPSGKDVVVPRTEPLRKHRFRELPLVTFRIPEGLWIAERIRKPQIEHFRLRSATSWLIKRTAYSMPIIQMENPDQENHLFGAGYYMKLGVNDKFGWSSPASTPFDIMAKDLDQQREDIYRIVHQAAQGLANNAETTGRSADSKELDVAATRIILNALGSAVRRAIEETLEILSDARGDVDVFWSIEGLSGYDTATASSLIAAATDAQLLGIPSKTFRREIKVKIAQALLPEADPAVREKIKQEIYAATDIMADIEELELSPDHQNKMDIAELKAKTALQVEDKKAETSKTVAKSAAKAAAAAPKITNAVPKKNAK